MKDDIGVALELAMFAFNIKKKYVMFWTISFHF
jgi:hypothetical protein